MNRGVARDRPKGLVWRVSLCHTSKRYATGGWNARPAIDTIRGRQRMRSDLDGNEKFAFLSDQLLFVDQLTANRRREEIGGFQSDGGKLKKTNWIGWGMQVAGR